MRAIPSKNTPLGVKTGIKSLENCDTLPWDKAWCFVQITESFLFLSSPVKTGRSVTGPTVAECCRGANKSRVSNQQQDAIQEKLVVNSTMAAS